MSAAVLWCSVSQMTEMLETMLTVATTVKGLELKKAPGKKKKQQGKKKAPAAIDPAALDAAVASAQSKFDAPEAFFEKEGGGGRAEYLRVLYEEVVASEDLGPAALFASLKKKNATPEEKQLPVVPAYALCIHKASGMSQHRRAPCALAAMPAFGGAIPKKVAEAVQEGMQEERKEPAELEKQESDDGFVEGSSPEAAGNMIMLKGTGRADLKEDNVDRSVEVTGEPESSSNEKEKKPMDKKMVCKEDFKDTKLKQKILVF